LKPATLILGTAVSLGLYYFGEEWYHEYSKNSELREACKGLFYLDLKNTEQVQKSVEKLKTLTNIQEQKEIATDFGVIEGLLHVLSQCEQNNSREFIIDQIRSFIEIGISQRQRFLNSNGIKEVIKLAKNPQLRKKVCELLFKVTKFETKDQILPDDIPDGCEGVLSILKLKDEEFDILIEILSESKRDSTESICGILSSCSNYPLFAKKLSSYSKDKCNVVLTLSNHLSSGTRTERTGNYALLCLSNISKVDFENNQQILLEKSNLEKFLKYISVEDCERPVLDLFCEILSFLSKKSNLNDKIEFVAKLLTSETSSTKRLLSNIESEKESLRERCSTLISRLSVLDVESEEKLLKWSNEESERIKKIRKQEEEKRKKDFMSFLSQQGMM